MDALLWILAGGLGGWIGFVFLGLNASRGVLLSMGLGAVAGFAGGYVLGPMLGSAMGNPDDFDPFALFMAFASAAACLIVCDMISRRLGD